MRRRDFIALAGVAGICPLCPPAAASATPIVGVIGESSPGKVLRLPAIQRGLKDGGYVEGQNVAIDNRWGNGHYDQLSQIVTDLVRRQVAVIITTGGSALARIAKTATATIPIVFTIGDDPVQLGLVDSLSHPGGNMTGFSLYTTELMAKRLELLHEMVPRAGTVALLVGAGPDATPLLSKQQAERAANTLGLKILGFKVGSMIDFEAALAAAAQQGAQALVLAAAPFFTGQSAQIIALAARYQLPAIYPWREFIEDGGLMSYGPDVAEVYRQVGRYAGRILDGTAPRELPVQLPTKFELIINLKTAKTLGLTVPRLLSAWADHVIE
jgi:putative ABC transport system substrate-binding protein